MVEHVSIVDSDRHEPKHASTALNGQVLKSIGLGQTAFAYPTYTELLAKPTSVGYKQVLTGASTAASQLPVGLDTPLQVEFGPGIATTDVTLSNLGLITFNTTGQYIISLFMRFGRTAGGGASILFTRFLVNGVQGLNSNAATLLDSQVVLPFAADLYFNITVPGTTWNLQIMRDSGGANTGGLYQTLPTPAGWNPSPSATIVVNKFTGLQ